MAFSMTRKPFMTAGLFLVTLLAGCQFYWGKTGATAQQFETDSNECAKEAYPTPQLAAYGGDASQRVYRACLRARGWVREKHAAPGDGWYRGIEDWD
jgi:hypothetical protein